MAHESANPKIRVMFLIAALSALTLGGLDQVFRSYFNMMMEEEEQEKVLGVPPTQLIQLRASEQQRLTSASLPIDKAMRELATRGREDPALKDLARTDISPQASNDLGPLTGWTLLARDAGPAAPGAPNEPNAADGGAPGTPPGAPGMAAADGGAAHPAPLGAEAGAPRAPQPKAEAGVPVAPHATADAGEH